MAFRQKEVPDANGCREMKGYCNHYRKFWCNGHKDKDD
ncbi:Uncharacterised protein [uncultured archaeon]|nr:Uncharacterised protein [uncultured archaeon]